MPISLVSWSKWLTIVLALWFSAADWQPAFAQRRDETRSEQKAATQPRASRLERQQEELQEYVGWLEDRSMLAAARRQADQISGQGVQWQSPYGDPQPRAAVRRASVWLLDYPGSVITGPDQSVLATWGRPELWQALEYLGIELLHTGPVKRAGGIVGRRYTPTIDGWFDRISLEIDPQLGTEQQYRQMVQTAARHGGLVAGDLVPLHTGLGPDFRLAELAYRDYPGMYTMVEVPRSLWRLLPDVDKPWGAEPLPKQSAEELYRQGLIPGLINSNDASEEARNRSGWSASGEIRGVDGRTRRWVYLHYFKNAQPALNWLDPSYAAERAIAGDVVKTIHTLGARMVRLDAVPFLGIEPQPDDPLSKHFQHPLSIVGTNSVAMLTRKLGGHSFHELNVPLEQLKEFTRHGPDLSYDFFTRAQCLHALLTGDAGALRQSFEMLLQAEVDPLSLVHDLQNHDEITYQLVELKHRGDETFTINGEEITGNELRETMLDQMRRLAAGEAAPHNRLYRPEKDGLATTFAAFVAAGLKIRDPYQATADQRQQIRRGHLLLTMANAMQPGVFSLSSWDLVGALPVAEKAVRKWAVDGDYRWINRGGVDLLGSYPDADKSAIGLPKAPSLYGSLSEQLKDRESFAMRLRQILRARKEHRLAEAELIQVAAVEQRGSCLLVMRLPDERLAVTALNFGRSEASETLDLEKLPGIELNRLHGAEAVDIVSGEQASRVERGKLVIELDALSGQTLVIAPH
jgi:maltose alpha-D-glucosyltransferase/alpha-amylase